MKEKTGDKEITRTWITGKKSCTLVIPKRFAVKHGLEEPTHVIIESRSDGLLIRKLEVL